MFLRCLTNAEEHSMRMTILIAWFAYVLTTGCAGPGPDKSSGISTRNESTKISFGIYDIAKGPSLFDLFAPPDSLYQNGISASTTTDPASPSQQPKGAVDSARIRQTNIADRDAG